MIKSTVKSIAMKLLANFLVVLSLFPFLQGKLSPIKIPMSYTFTAQLELHYIEQPPKELQCNPYYSNATWIPSLLCIVAAEITTIQWYHNSTDGDITKLNSTNTRSGARENVLTITQFTGLVSKEFNETLVGNYYCQVTNSNNVTILSNILTVLPPENYTNLPQCPSIITQGCPNSTVPITTTITKSITPVLTPSVDCRSSPVVISNSSVVGWITSFSILLVINILLVTLIAVCISLVAYKRYQMESKDEDKGKGKICTRKLTFLL